MPLDPDSHGVSGILHRFYDAVGCDRADLQSAGFPERLAVVTVDLSGAERSLHLMAGSIPMDLRRRKGVRQMLFEGSAGMQAHQLHAEADREQRMTALGERIEEFELEGLPSWCDERGRGVVLDPEVTQVGVVTSGGHDRVAAGEVLGDRTVLAGEEQGDATSSLHHLRVGETTSVRRVIHVDGDADPRTGS